MRITRLGTLAVLMAAFAVACGGTATEEKTTAAPAAELAEESSPEKAAEPAEAAAGEIGVPECDDYIQKYEACVEGKVPEAARATVKTAFEQTRESWKQAAATPEGKAGLAMACSQALTAAKQAMAAYGCEW